jgi:tryptophan 2,3-dioxygenase
MAVLEMLAKKVNHPDFAKAWRRNKVKAIEEVIGRPLASHERAGVKTLTHTQLKHVVKALRPRKGGPHPPE